MNDRARGPWPAWVSRLGTRPGIALSFLWGLAEATFFFVVPDVLISLAAAYEPRRALRHIVAATAGAVLGGAGMYAWATASPATARAGVEQVPFVRRAMIDGVEKDYQKHGAGAVFRGPIAGIPYKIYAVQAPANVAMTVFLLVSVPARAARFVLVWLCFSLAGWGLRRMWPERVAIPTAAHAVFWVGFYSYYWAVI